MCLLILKVLLDVGVLECLCLISVAAEWDGLPCDIHHLCHSGFICNMITYTRRENAHARPHITKKPGSDLSVLNSTRSLDGLRDTAGVFHDSCGQPCDEKLIITLCSPGEWQGGHAVMSRKEFRSGNRPEAYCGDSAIATSAPVATQTGSNAHTCTHTQKWGSYWDGQCCHQWLSSCHSDMERLGPYERLCSPKRYLGAGAAETRQSLLMRS